VLAAHRGTADAAGVDWKFAVYRKIQKEVKAGGRLVFLQNLFGDAALRQWMAICLGPASMATFTVCTLSGIVLWSLCTVAGVLCFAIALVSLLAQFKAVVPNLRFHFVRKYGCRLTVR
jgi:hypothetical protein